jgi:uncharacterized protein (TIGR01319 family)
MGCLKYLIDLGSTFTKVAVVDLEQGEIKARVAVPSTVGTDVMVGLNMAIEQAKGRSGVAVPGREDLMACSSAAGGLRMVAVGLVPRLSTEAAERAALGAGARVLAIYSYDLSRTEIEEIVGIAPDIILLCGGTDGGEKRNIIHNANILAKSKLTAPIVVAGNKAAQDEVEDILASAGKLPVLCQNVLPEINVLNADPCHELIRELFMKRIIKAKGIAQVREVVGNEIIPTPVAVLNAVQLLSDGYMEETGLGELLAVDVGGATTDVYSVAKGWPTRAGVILRGLEEPYVKRTVEGDLGVRWNMDNLVKIGQERKLLPLNSRVDELACKLGRPGILPANQEETDFDTAVAQIAVEVAVERHVGRLESIYGPSGENLVQRGKDLTGVKAVVGTGGPLAFSSDPWMILQGACAGDRAKHNLLKPLSPTYFIDSRYILYAVGLISEVAPKEALVIAKKYVKPLASSKE